jgi:hypothetical protein
MLERADTPEAIGLNRRASALLYQFIRFNINLRSIGNRSQSEDRSNTT